MTAPFSSPNALLRMPEEAETIALTLQIIKKNRNDFI